MHRISTDIEYLQSGKVIIDADGVPVDLGYRGIGSPEGRVTAPVGSIYTDTASTNGAIRWIKASGTGTTGWKVQYGDTGWRSLTNSGVAPGWSGGFYVRRIDNTVHIRLHQLAAGEDATVTLVNIPTGFRADSIGSVVGRYLLHEADRESTMWRVYFAGSSLLLSVVPGPTARLYGDVSWNTSEAWPTSLPGTPA